MTRLIPVDTSAQSPFTRGVMQGASLGWADELSGLVGGDAAAAREADASAANASPSSYNAGRLFGAVISPINLIPAGWLLRAGSGIGRVAGVGAGVGAATGAIESLGEQNETRGLNADTAVRTGVGAGIGGVVGGAVAPALHLIGSGVRRGGRYLTDWARGGDLEALRKTSQALERQSTDPSALAARLTADAAPTVQGQQPEALADILRGLQAGRTATEVAADVNAAHGLSLTPNQIGRISAGFNRANPVPRDLVKLSEEVGGGESSRSGLTSLMQGVASLPGRGREVALRNMGRTMEDAPQRLATRLSSETGQGLDFRRAFNERVAQRTTAANQAYGAAYQDNVAAAIASGRSISDTLQPLLERYLLRARALGGERRSHIAAAVEMLGGTNRATASGQMRVQTLEQFHRARKEFDRMLSSLNRSPNAADRDAARILNQMRDEVNRMVHQANPSFAQADARYASDLAREEAMHLGRQVNFRSGQAQDDVIDAMLALERRHPQHAEEIRDHFMQGVLRRMADEVETSGGIPTRWVQPLTGGIRPAQQQALMQTLGAPLPSAQIASRANSATGAVRNQPVPYQAGRDVAQGVTSVLEDEARLRKIFTDVFGNSNTAGKMAAVEDLRELPGIAAEMATGGWFAGLRRAIVDRLVRAMTERNTEQIARIVTETDPRVLYVALQDIQRMRPGMRASDRAISTPAVGIAAGIGQQVTDR